MKTYTLPPITLADDERLLDLFREAERRRREKWSSISVTAIVVSFTTMAWTLITMAYLWASKSLTQHDVRVSTGILAGCISVLFFAAAREHKR